MTTYFIDCSEKEIAVILYGEAYDEQNQRVGRYTRQSELKHGRPYYLNDHGNQSVWFMTNDDGGYWGVGDFDDYGTSHVGLKSTTVDSCPTNLKYQYYSDLNNHGSYVD